MEAIVQNPMLELVDHAEAKLAEEERFHAGMAKAGRKIPANRHDRRPLWEAVMFLAGSFSSHPLPEHVRSRGAAWEYLCGAACHLTAKANRFEALLDLHRIFLLPEGPMEQVLGERARRREAQAVAARQARADRLREELRQVEASLPPAGVLPSNVLPFRARAS